MPKFQHDLNPFEEQLSRYDKSKVQTCVRESFNKN